ncbi:MAG: MmgE/PrpD family protein [Rubrobacteraceae bacterium]|nr:MmgE/PrpD family protein [Rubrobacteraceae bacterium]
MSDTILTRIARFAGCVRSGEFGEDVIKDAHRRLLDTLGVALAASGMEPARISGAVIRGWGGEEQATIVRAGRRYPVPSAAFVNGTLAHSLDFDDTHLPSVLHPSAAVVPAALAAAEAAGASGTGLMAAIAAGDELVVRAGMAGYDEDLGSSVFFERGLHATSICGTLGAALASAMLLGLPEEKIGHAVSISASMGAGIIEANRTGGTVKRIHCGWAAHCGVVAAELARAGLTGPPTVFEGRFGFLRAYLGDDYDVCALVRGLGEEWESEKIFFKPYPANHFTHAAIDAALELRREGIRADKIEDILLGVPAQVLKTIAEPREAKARPESGYAARFSGPFVVASAFLGGGGLGVGLDDFTDEATKDPRKLRLASLVRCVADEECTRIFPRQFPAVLRVRLYDGGTRIVRVLHNRGGPENPLSDEELAVKFRSNASRVFDRSRVQEIEDALMELGPRPEGVARLSRLLRAPADHG